MTHEEWATEIDRLRSEIGDDEKAIATTLLSHWGATRINPRIRDGIAVLVFLLYGKDFSDITHP